MLSELKSLLGVKVLTKEEQKTLKGGGLCCDPLTQCCATASMCGTALCTGHGGCGSCCSQYCYSDYMYCGCV